eukprot:15361071-Heterocapsa_arctica.AAC.1
MERHQQELRKRGTGTREEQQPARSSSPRGSAVRRSRSGNSNISKEMSPDWNGSKSSSSSRRGSAREEGLVGLPTNAAANGLLSSAGIFYHGLPPRPAREA